MQVLPIRRLQARVDELLGHYEAFFIANVVWRYHFSAYAFVVFSQIVICKKPKRGKNQLLEIFGFSFSRYSMLHNLVFIVLFFVRKSIIHKQCLALIMLDSREPNWIVTSKNRHHLWISWVELCEWLLCGSKIFIFSFIDFDGFLWFT